MTNAPADLLAFRTTVMHLTGLTDPASVGIVGDSAHAASGGYHEGRGDLTRAGVWYTDYSLRLTRDRNACTESASAMDIGYDWPKGGSAAWLRFNNALVAALHGGDPALAAIRAVNYSPGGGLKRRTDRESGWSVVASGDTVDVHTHIEWYRDTEGNRQASLDRLTVLIQAAVNNTTPENDMTPEQDAKLTQIANDVSWLAPRVEALKLGTNRIQSGSHEAGQDMALMKTVNALAAAPSATLAVTQEMLNAAVATNAQTIADLVAANLAARLES